ncbi:MAG: sulfite exporter TauE/SafE family protein [Acidobacteriota bacterium]
MTEWAAYVILFPAGFVAGALNVVAGGGSFLTLPLLIFLGLPPTVANGTNRVAILFQSTGAAWSFHRYRLMDWQWAIGAAVPATLGAAIGTGAAIAVGDEAFRKILAFLMVAVTLWTLTSPVKSRSADPAAPPPSPGRGAVLGFFAVGIYGGFVQAGVGFFALAVTTMAGLDLVRGNTIKVFCILVFTVLSLTIFAWQGMVDWLLGLTLAVGTTLGGLFGARLAALKGHRWIRVVVTITVILFAIRLGLGS